MPFVIDGYNLLHAMGLLGGPVGPHRLAKARAGLLGLVAAVHADSDPATIVFDARRAPARALTTRKSTARSASSLRPAKRLTTASNG